MLSSIPQQHTLLRLEGVTKRFGGVPALDSVDFNLREGEIHALLGENGAGKSTLIKILAGIYSLDCGCVLLHEKTIHIHGISDADRYGIRVIHQELSLAPNLSIAENIYLGREPHRWGWLNRKKMMEDADALAVRLELNEIRPVDRIVSELSVGRRQLVEIARALSCESKILILDEPTSSLSDVETEALFAALRNLRAQGVGIIYISHRLEEIIRLADRITVLRDGQAIGTQPVSQVDRRELVRWMVGRDIVDHFHRSEYDPGAVALEARDVRNKWVNGVSFEVRYGEILGLAGLVGAGRSELARALFGIDAIDEGEIRIDGTPVCINHPWDALGVGIALVPEDRRKDGLVMIQSLAFNLALPWTREWNPPFFPDRRKRESIIQKAIDNFQIKTADPEQCIDRLSGGNQQKALVGRWMEKRPKVLILDEPTRGVDVGAREEMFRLINQLVEDGMAIVMISSDLEEVLNCSHRIALYRDGRIIGTAPSDSLTPEEAMARLAGISA